MPEEWLRFEVFVFLHRFAAASEDQALRVKLSCSLGDAGLWVKLTQNMLRVRGRMSLSEIWSSRAERAACLQSFSASVSDYTLK